MLFGNAVVSIVIIGFVFQGCLCTQKQDSLFKFKLQVLVLNNNVTSGKAVGTSIREIFKICIQKIERICCAQRPQNVQMNSIVHYDSELCKGNLGMILLMCGI